MDGSSYTDGSRTELILINPEGMEFTYALRFRFDAINNEAEYEALMVGLWISEQMGVKNLQENMDSRLVANQVNRTYVAKDADMIRYLEKVKALTGSFKAFSIKQIPRSENKKADSLSKIASTSFAHYLNSLKGKLCALVDTGCHVTILNTSDHLGKFDGKADEGYIFGYSASNKAYMVYNVPNKRVEETMNMRFLEEKPNVQGLGIQGATTNPAGTQDVNSDSDCDEQVIIVPSYPSHSIQGAEPKDTSSDEVDDSLLNSAGKIFQKELARLKVPPSSIPVYAGYIQIPVGATMVSTDDFPIHTSSSTDSFFNNEPTTRFSCLLDLGNHDPSPGIFSSSSYDDEFGAALNNVASTMETTTGEYAFISYLYDQQRDNHTDFQHCLFACSLSQDEPCSVAHALEDLSWVNAMQEEMQQFKFQNARLVAQGHRQEEGIDYDEVFATIARIKAIRLFLAFASYMGFMVYQMDVKSAFLYKRINEEVYVTQPKGFMDPQHPKKVYKAWCDEFEALMKGEFQMSAMGELTFFLGLQVQQRPDDIFINQDKYVQEILNKFDLGSVRTATTPYEALKPKSKNESDSPVNVHLYRSVIGSLMYLTASRPDIMFAVSACSRNQVTPTTSNLEARKKIFKYLKGQPKLDLWYPRESPLVLEAYSDSDYARENKDRKSTTGGCQFLGRRLISWKCKKQTIVATSSTEAEYVAAANCCGQVLWI
nr:putative ribonuclease H-like domain-containing protein [Tanacetum cinerariifolium]